jgi:hypothetical protein
MGPRVKSASFLPLFLLILLLIAGCTIESPPPAKDSGAVKPSPTATLIEDITYRNALRVSLRDALSSLPVAEREGNIDLRGLHIAKIWGYSVDSAGLARIWALGMKGPERTVLLTYSDGEFQVQDLPVDLPGGEVKIGELLTPQELFSRNLNTIVQEMNRLKVAECNPVTLEEDTYQVTIQSDTESSTLTFNARTGELIPSP